MNTKLSIDHKEFAHLDTRNSTSDSPPPPLPPRLGRNVPYLGDGLDDSERVWNKNNDEMSMGGEPTILPGNPEKESEPCDMVE